VKSSKLIWGTFFLLAATLIVFSQVNGFADIGVGSIIIAVLSLAVIVQSIAHLRFAPLPIPLAVLYVIFQTPLNLPHIRIWVLVLASVLASMGLAVLLPERQRRNNFETTRHRQTKNDAQRISTDSDGNDNNPSVFVNFGAVNRRLCADNLETARLSCNFGALKIFFDQVELSPSGAEVILSCSFGGIELYVPKHWRVIDKMNCTLGDVGINKGFAETPENAPTLTLTGSVSLGGIEVRYI